MPELQNNLREIQIVGLATREILIHPSQCPPFEELGINLAGMSWTTKDFRFVRRKPERGQFLIGLRGQGRVWFHGGWKACGPGQAYITHPGEFHAYEARSGWQVGWVVFERNSPLAGVGPPELLRVTPTPFQHILQGLHEESVSRADPTALAHWAGLLRQHCLRISGGEHPSRLWQLWQAVQRDLSFRWTLASLSRSAGLGAESLRLICQRELGRSPLQELRRLRMEHAIALLSAGQKVEYTARLVGYENAFAFSTAFKRTTGRTPSACQPLRTRGVRN